MSKRKTVAGINERLKSYRELMGLSQKEVANKGNFSPSVISEYESGNCQPSAYALARLSLAYGVSADYILGLELKNPENILDITGLSDDQKKYLRLFVESTIKPSK